MKNDEVRVTSDERKAEDGGIVIGRDILDMISDAGKRHESLRRGFLIATVQMTGGEVPKHWNAGMTLQLEHRGVYADGQNFMRTAKVKSTADMAAALREGFVDPYEYKWRRQSKAKEAADWVANFLPYAACLAIGLAIGRLSDKQAEQRAKAAPYQFPDAPCAIFEGGGAPVRDTPAHKGEVFVAEGADGLALDHAGRLEISRDAGLIAADDDDVGGPGDPAEKPVVPFVHADDSNTNRAEKAHD